MEFFNATHLRAVATETQAQTIINRLRYRSSVKNKLVPHKIKMMYVNTTYYSTKMTRDVSIDESIQYYEDIIREQTPTNTKRKHMISWDESLQILKNLKKILHGNMKDTTDEWDKSCTKPLKPVSKRYKTSRASKIKYKKQRQREFVNKFNEILGVA